MLTKVFLAVLAGLLAANAFIRPDHPHLAAEGLFGFWAAFGLGAGLVLCLAAGAVLGPLLRLPPEDGHDA